MLRTAACTLAVAGTAAWSAEARAPQRPTVRLASGFELRRHDTPSDAAGDNATIVPLQVLYSTQYLDNVVAGTNETFNEALAKGYVSYPSDDGACVTAPGDGLIPLKTFYSSTLRDTLTTASADGLAWAAKPENGYEFVRTECYCSEAQPTGPSFKVVTWWSAQRNDTFLVKVGSQHQQDAIGAGYTKVSDRASTAVAGQRGVKRRLCGSCRVTGECMLLACGAVRLRISPSSERSAVGALQLMRSVLGSVVVVIAARISNSVHLLCCGGLSWTSFRRLCVCVCRRCRCC